MSVCHVAWVPGDLVSVHLFRSHLCLQSGVFVNWHSAAHASPVAQQTRSCFLTLWCGLSHQDAFPCLRKAWGHFRCSILQPYCPVLLRQTDTWSYGFEIPAPAANPAMQSKLFLHMLLWESLEKTENEVGKVSSLSLNKYVWEKGTETIIKEILSGCFSCSGVLGVKLNYNAGNSGVPF